ncbi:DNA polymerase zeta catalytic subunit-like [Quercus robur]|uniref:DNA polymerase zeta catalytic subunit-like n=1 Tax=Quercus robur TaxID=38942 RepID=UPI0021624BE6|nr:DNA polymerase zeta catalytic subunit-like [Quercus robur]
MADSELDINAFSVRIVTIDHYMAPPIHGLHISYSTFQGGKVSEVPVIRIYVSTPAGQKTCLHVHGVMHTHAVSLALEKALKACLVATGFVLTSVLFVIGLSGIHCQSCSLKVMLVQSNIMNVVAALSEQGYFMFTIHLKSFL